MQKPAVVLLSGGLDSATALAIAKSEGFACHALSFDYGQRHHVEIECARNVAKAIGALEHKIVELDLRALGGSALTDDIPVPRNRSFASNDIPITYVPARNLIFLSIALAYAEVLASQDIFIGVNALDYSGYPDCRPEFIQSFENTAALATKAGVHGSRVEIHTPLVAMTKAQIIREGARLGVDFSLTSSCYDPTPTGQACGECDACALRRKGFLEAGIEDPTKYAAYA